MRQEIEDSHCDEPPIEPVELVKAAEFLAIALVGMERRGAEESLEAGALDFEVFLLVHVGLVVAKELKFLFGEDVGVEGDIELVGGFDVRL
jgi:hypothetical protein